MTLPNQYRRTGRRTFLCGGTLLLASAATGRSLFRPDQSALRIGLMTDLHYADKPPAGTRHYRETLGKLADAVQSLRQEAVDFVVELGDLIDSAETEEAELRHLTHVNAAFVLVHSDRHYVLGNHCVHRLTKQEFLQGIERKQSSYAFDRGDWHFVVLDACFRSDGAPYERNNFDWKDANVPNEQLKWLEADLAQTDRPVVVFAHQRLDVASPHSVRNHAEVRRVLESSGRVRAVFQGHSHKNDLQDIGGIHYCTLVAMVEGSGKSSSGCAAVELHSDGTIQVKGFLRQQSYQWMPPA